MDLRAGLKGLDSRLKLMVKLVDSSSVRLRLSMSGLVGHVEEGCCRLVVVHILQVVLLPFGGRVRPDDLLETLIILLLL